MAGNEGHQYFDVLTQSLRVGCIAIINTFAKEGEVQCTGLHTFAYNEEDMQEALPQSLELVSYNEFIHSTPKKTQQKYSSFIIKRMS